MASPPATPPPDAEAPKRKRLNMACDGCRRKKVRCDGERPRCRNCVRHGLDCVYVSGGRRGRIGRGRVGRPALSATSSNAAAATTTAPTHTVALTASTRSSPDPSSPNSPSPPFDPSGAVGNPSQIRQTTVTALAVNLDTSIRRLHTSLNLGNTSGLTYRSPFFPKLLTGPVHPVALASPEPVPAPAPATIEPPPPELTTAWWRQPEVARLVDLFLTFGQHHVPVADPGSLRAALAEGHPAVLLSAVCAFATNFLEPAERPPLAGRYVRLFEALLPPAQARPSLALIQALLIMAHHESAVAHLYRAWHYSGQASRLTLGLGLNVLDGDAGANHPSARALPTDAASLEGSRRLFWSCFLYDRLWSLALGYSPAIDERDICLYLPRSHQDWFALPDELPELYEHDEIAAAMAARDAKQFAADLRTLPHLGPDAYFIKLITLLGDILRIRNRSARFYSSHADQLGYQFELLVEVLTHWALSLPDALKLSQIPPAGPVPLPPSEGRRRSFILTQYAYYHTITMFLFRCRIHDETNRHPTIPGGGEDDAGRCFARCYQAMAGVAEIARLTLAIDPRFLSPFLPFAFYHAALFLIGYTDRSPPHALGDHRTMIADLRTALQHTAGCWQLASLYLRVIDVDGVVEDEAVDMAEPPARRAPVSPVKPAPLLAAVPLLRPHGEPGSAGWPAAPFPGGVAFYPPPPR
ncbi:hypothetical protein IWQ60_007093 [Tieghemiomyces parasiticus]|uniref:Zn(2)-C6 fungal-type domain-containing protein n=1 Tax=Tieghemiomyces parasiticus TaxID=78921 RepID=A0A9W7ZZZ1_9FUNG|nr:hypothetical protein IWQ60_007093 [Tieghemiomyces parasiticus]